MKRTIRACGYLLLAVTVMLSGARMPVMAAAQESQQIGVTVNTREEFMNALAQHKSPITVDEHAISIIGEGEESSGRMRPVMIPANTVIQGMNGGSLSCRGPIQLEGDGVRFQNIKLTFTSADALGSVPHREIFLAGHSLTMDNVKTYEEGGGGDLGGLGSSEKELLPTVYAGGYPETSVDSNASLTVENSNRETMFQAIRMGHEAGEDNNVPYKGDAVLNLDAEATVREEVNTSLNNRAQINLAETGYYQARTKVFYGNENTTMTMRNMSMEDAIVKDIGNIVLQDKACLSSKTAQLGNVTLRNGACLDFNGVSGAVVSGDFIGEMDHEKEKGILVLNPEESLSIKGNVSGTTQFQTGHRLFPGHLLLGKAYIVVGQNKASGSEFVLAQKSLDNGYELEYEAGAWKIAGEPIVSREIGRIDITHAPSKVDLRKIAAKEDESIPDENTYFEVTWYDKSGEAFSAQEVDDYLFYEFEYVVRVRTDYWESNDADVLDKTDWFQFVTLMASKEHPGKYYLQAYDEATPGDYTFLFCSDYFEGDLYTVADVKALKDSVMAEQRVIFYDQDLEEHQHVYQSEVTKVATCTEAGIKTYTCQCGEQYTETIEALGHKEIIDPAVAPTETATGKTEGSHCRVCGAVLKAQETIPAIGRPVGHQHVYQSKVTKTASLTETGLRTYICSCGEQYIETIDSPETIIWDKRDFTYDGKAKMPSCMVKDSKGRTLTKGEDYKVSYSKGRKNPGVYTVAVEFCGDYSGTTVETFTIRPKKTSLKKLTAKSRGVQAAWKKQTTQIDGYQLQYSTSGSFKGKNTKTTTAKKTVAAKKISKLKGQKKYYVRIRTYKNAKVNGKNKKLYSDWSGKKSVRTKR